MGLKLQAVAPRQGWTWVRDGVRLYLRRPVAFTAMLVLFLLASGLWSVLPVVGLAALASLPTDYLARQKHAGANLNFFKLEQVPLPPLLGEARRK